MVVSLVYKLVCSMKLLGITIDKDRNFTEHVADIVRRISNQIQVTGAPNEQISKKSFEGYFYAPCNV